MNDTNVQLEQDRERIRTARQKGTGATVALYTKLSGPGWLQGAITLGGASLGGSLYLGVIAGYEMMWIQPLMLILGIVMLSAIGYVALSTGERPFRTINTRINPVLGWGWAIATLMANMVWAMPQFSLGTAAMQQNLFPELLGGETGKWICVGLLFFTASTVIWFYDSGGWGVRLFEIILKVMVGIVVLCFVGVVISMSVNEGLPWGTILAGFIPSPSQFFEPPETLRGFIAASSDPDYWNSLILSTQRDRMVTAAAGAVGINMTFLLPYSMLRRGWDRDFRGLAIFDLSIGLFVPFLLATSCVVIASAARFHGIADQDLVDGKQTAATEKLVSKYNPILDQRIQHELGEEAFAALNDEEKQDRRDALPQPDRELAAMLINRDAFTLAQSLEGLTGSTAATDDPEQASRPLAQYVFGIGVLGMAVSTIIILMLINGFTVCEMLGRDSEGGLHRFASLLPGISGGLGFLLLWGTDQANFLLVQPTSIFGMTLLPLAYIIFCILMNSRSVLGDDMPQGGKRVLVNALMLTATGAAAIGAGWSIWVKAGWYGVAAVGAFVALALAVQFLRKPQSDATTG